MMNNDDATTCSEPTKGMSLDELRVIMEGINQHKKERIEMFEKLLDDLGFANAMPETKEYLARQAGFCEYRAKRERLMVRPPEPKGQAKMECFRAGCGFRGNQGFSCKLTILDEIP